MSENCICISGTGCTVYRNGERIFMQKYAVSREVFESASKASGLDVKALCFEENDILNITEYTQIAMLTAEIAILRAVEEAGIRSQVNAGLSLGEYGALVASGVMKEEDAFTVVRKRGSFYAGGISYRWCNVRCSWNRCRDDRKKSAMRHRELYPLQIITVRDRL